MNQRRQHISELIRDAFKGVSLGNGVGLWQGQALDDYADQSTIAKSRTKDEKDNWDSIPVDELNRCHSSLSFFDAEGMSFHLPAFLLADIDGKLSNGIIFYLTNLDDYTKSKYTLLSDEQRHAVRELLLLYETEEEFEYERPVICRALKEYWTV